MVNNIQAVNFLSWKQLEFNVNSGVTLIDGWNDDDQTSEGSGKSAILNALSWGLYGKIPKDAKVDDVIKNGEKSCAVSITLSNGLSIVRTRKPNDLYLIKDGQNIKGKDAKETQQIIEDTVGLSFETFCQTVYFAQNYDKKFITSNQEEKAKILSEVQDLQVFDKARKEVMVLLKTEESNLLNLQNSVQVLRKDEQLATQAIEHQRALKAQLEAQKQEKLATLLNQINSLSADIDKAKDERQTVEGQLEITIVPDDASIRNKNAELNTELNVIKQQLANFSQLQADRTKKETMGKSYAARYKKYDEEIAKLEDFIKNPTEHCPTCGHETGQGDTSHAQQKIVEIKEEQKSILGMLQNISSELETPLPPSDELQRNAGAIVKQIEENNKELLKIEQVKKEVNMLEGRATTLSYSIDDWTARAKHFAQEHSKINTESVNIDDSKLREAETKLAAVQSEIKTIVDLIQNSQAHINKLTHLKDGFKEVKVHIFNSLLNEINSRVNIYLQKLFEVPASIKFMNDNMKIETNVSLDGTDRGLGLLSGGQFRRVSLAVDLALSDVINGRKNSKFGILILDEYFKDLSENSMEKCLELLQQRNQPVLLIEHNSIFKNIIDNTFFVKLEKGTSRAEI